MVSLSLPPAVSPAAEPVPELAWVVSITNSYASMVVADDGSIYGAGRGNANGTNLNRLFKWDNTGSFVWARDVGQLGWAYDYDVARAVALDRQGHVYFAATFTGNVTIGNETLTNDSGLDHLFLAKFSTSGTLSWAVADTEVYTNYYPYSVAADSSGNVYVAGNRTLVQGPNFEDQSNFLRKYGPDGALLWERRSLRFGIGPRISAFVDRSDHVRLVGYYNAVYPYGTLVPDSSETRFQCFIAKHDPDGNVMWLKNIATNGHDFFQTGCAMDSQGCVWLAGEYGRNLDLGEVVLTNTTTTPRAFLAKIDSTGRTVAVVESGGNARAVFVRVATDAADNVYATSPGYWSGATIGYTNLPRQYSIAKFDSQGSLHWLYGTHLLSDPIVLAVDSAANLYAAKQGSMLKLGSTGPPLHFVSQPGGVSLNWSSLAEGFRLEATLGLADSNWMPVATNTLRITPTSIEVTLPSTASRQFFRLHKPAEAP